MPKKPAVISFLSSALIQIEIVLTPPSAPPPNKEQQPIVDVLRVLETCGEMLGYKTQREWHVPMGRIDLVWYTEMTVDLPQFNVSRIPIIAFEIETSWRTRKHIKGDILNFQAIHAAYGVIVQQTSSNDNPGQVKALIANTREFLKTLGLTSVAVWTEADVIDLALSLSIPLA